MTPLQAYRVISEALYRYGPHVNHVCGPESLCDGLCVELSGIGEAMLIIHSLILKDAGHTA